MRTPLINARRSLFALANLCLVASAAAQTAPDTSAPGDNPDGEKIVHMSPLSVTAQSTGYYDMTASGATRTNTALIDIPQTVDIVTSQMWKDEDITQWNDAFSYMANVEVRNRFAGFGDGVNIRGFSNFSNSTGEDGILVGDQPFKRDIIGYDQLQIIKGPPSAVQGIASGLGYLNWILKKPDLSHNFADISAQYTNTEGGYDGARATFDVNRIITSDDSMGFRVAGAYSDQDEYIKFTRTEMRDIFPSYEWKIDKNTELVVTTELYDDKTPSREEGHGFAFYPYADAKIIPVLNYPSDPILNLHLPRDFSISGPGDNEYERVWYSTVFLTHDFNEHLSYRQAVNAGTSSIDSQAYTAQNDEVTMINYAYIHTIDQRHSETLQGDFFAKYDWNFVTSNTLVGWNYRDESTNIEAWTVTPTGPFITNGQINIAALAASGDSASFFANRVVPNANPSAQTYQAETDVGAYAEQSLGLFHDLILLNGSVRRDSAHSRTFNEITNAQATGYAQWLTSYRYGITVKPTSWLAIYGVDSLQNNPEVTYQRYNGLLAGDPRLTQYFGVAPDELLREFGIKSTLFGGRLIVTVDHWAMNVTGSVVNFVQSGTSQAPATLGQTVSYGTETVLTGSETHGYEAEAEGAVTDRLSIIANYTRMISSVQNSADPGNPNDLVPLQFDPIWSANLWAKYSFHAPRQSGLEVKAGYRAIGPYSGQVTLPANAYGGYPSGAYQVYIPQSQYTIDAGLSYIWGRYSIDFMGRNLNNSVFLLTRDIAPRTFITTLTAHF